MDETNNINNPEQYSSPSGLPADRHGEGVKAQGANAPARMNTSSDGGEANDEISLKELILKLREWWRYLLSKWIIIVIVFVIGGILGFAYAYSKKPLYTAELTFVLEGGKQVSGLGSLASQFGIGSQNTSASVFEGANLLSLMISRTMIEKTLLTTVNVKGKKQTLAEFYIDINNLREQWAKADSPLSNVRFPPGADPSRFSSYQNSLISSFHGTLTGKNLIVGGKDKSSLMSIRLTSKNELFSKYFVDVLAKEVSDFYIDSKVKNIKKSVVNMERQADSVRREFNSAITNVASSIDANPNANPARQRLNVPSQRRQVDAQVNQAMLIELVKNIETSKMTMREETPLIQIVDRPVLPLPKEELSRIKGLVLGGVLAGLIAVIVLALKKGFNDLMA